MSLPISSIPYVLSLNFEYFIDLTMLLLFFVNPRHYISCIAYLLIGCLYRGACGCSNASGRVIRTSSFFYMEDGIWRNQGGL